MEAESVAEEEQRGNAAWKLCPQDLQVLSEALLPPESWGFETDDPSCEYYAGDGRKEHLWLLWEE